MKIKEDVIITCPTYKDAFILRRALIDLGYKYINLFNIKQWKNIWNIYKENTIYHMSDNKVFYGNVKSCKRYYTLQEFIKKYIRYYE